MAVKNHLKLRHSTKICAKEIEVKDRILEDTKKKFNDSIPALKNNQQFVLDVCIFVENELAKKKVDKKKYDKKAIVINALNDLFTLDEEDIVRISSAIDFLHQNGNIKRDKLPKRILRGLIDFVVNFFLRK